MIATVHQNYPTGCDTPNKNNNTTTTTSSGSISSQNSSRNGATMTKDETTMNPVMSTLVAEEEKTAVPTLSLKQQPQASSSSSSSPKTVTSHSDPLVCSPLTPEGARSKMMTRIAPLPSENHRSITTSTSSSSSSSRSSSSSSSTIVFRMAVQSLWQSIRMDPKFYSTDRFTEELSDAELLWNHHSSRLPECLTTATTNRHLNDNHDDRNGFFDWACDAIASRQVPAAMTGAILSTLQTILEHEDDIHNHHNNDPSETIVYHRLQEEDLWWWLSKIANALMHCAFEESSSSYSSTGGTFSYTNNSNNNHNKRLVPPPPSILTSRFSDNNNHYSFRDDDEQVVHKLLQLCVLVTRLSVKHSLTTKMSDPTGIVPVGALFDTCWHVRFFAETASSVLKQCAVTACQDILKAVFTSGHNNNTTLVAMQHELLQAISQKFGKSVEETWVALQLIEVILLLQCSHHREYPSASSSVDESTITTATIELWREIATQLLSVGIATHHIPILGKMCHIFGFLVWQHPLLSLDTLQCEYEVFVQSVLLQRLTTNTNNNNPVGAGTAAAQQEVDTATKHYETEVVLETLIQICRSGGFGSMSVDLADIYINYDCDIACTNMYQAILTRLAATASPDPKESKVEMAPHMVIQDPGLSPNTLPLSSTGLAKTTATMPNGVAIVDSAQVGPVSATNGTANSAGSGTNTTTTTTIVTPKQLNVTPEQMNHNHHLALNAMLSVLEYIDQRTSGMVEKNYSVSCGPQNAKPITEGELEKRKSKKNQLAKVVDCFNTGNPDKGQWLEVAVAQGILENSHDAKAVAKLLSTAPDFDKRRIGIYLSRGPEASFPFHKAVREEFSKLHDYNNLSFASALRRFLAKFRLPGEAQCIDRLMEAFSQELYRQQSSTTFFKNADAVYVLAFSTIMLNTDLHNPTIKTDKRMTKEQFIRNNRGINGGDDIPEDFLSELYDQIKEHQLQVRREASEHLRKFHRHGCPSLREGIREKEKEVQSAVYLSYDGGWTGFHEKEMFKLFSSTCLKSIHEVYLRTWDDATIVRILRGLQQMARVAAHLELDCVLNDVLKILFKQGKEYVRNCISLGLTAPITSMIAAGEQENNATDESLNEEETTTVGMETIPIGLLCSNADGKVDIDISGSGANRGMLALDCSFVLLHKYYVNVLDSWPEFVDCLCALRDAHALPSGLADLDDFADSNGNVLPLSDFAKSSQKSLEEYQNSLRDDESNKDKGWFRGFFRKSRLDDNNVEENHGETSKSEPSLHVKTLLSVAKAADIEGIVELASPILPDYSIRKLIDTLNAFPFEDDPCAEQHAVFSLELATRALLSNRKRAVELFPLFLSKFESVLCRVQGENVPCPFVIERIVVTILRSNIHLYEIPELRAHLRAALQLITMTLPRSFIRAISDRMACGLAIILRSSFHFFDTHAEWAIMGDTLDLLSNYRVSRGFVFDGIASTVEYSLPKSETLSDSIRGSDTEDEKPREHVKSRPELSKEACSVLSRILTRLVLGFYQGDVSLSVAAMLCLEKLYRHKVTLLLREVGPDETSSSPLDPITAVPDKEFWQNVAVAVYSVCRSTNPATSREGMKCFQRIILKTAVDEIPDEKWIAILYLMVNKQPPYLAEASRSNTFSVLGHLLARVLPAIKYTDDVRADLEDLITQTAALSEENMRRRGILFESTLQTLMYLSSQLSSEKFGGSSEFNRWANEVLLRELERVGNVGGRPLTTGGKLVEDVSDISESAAEDEDPIIES